MNKNIYIYGAGKYGVLTAFDCEQKGIKVTGFIDRDAEKIKMRLGLPVLILDSVFNESYKSKIIIAIQNKNAIEEVTEILKSNKIGFEISNVILNSQVTSPVTYYTNPKRNSKEAPPPSTIPENLKNNFTMNGQIPVLYWYLDERNDSRIHNSAEDYRNAFEKLENKTFKYYGEDINSFYQTFEKYSLKDKTVLIWGLAGLNCEAMSIWQGAKHVFVVDYNKPICEHEKITVMNHEELLKSGIKTDIAISFSSFEHDGLGRYGDPLNPNGDLEAMQTARDFLKDDGFMLFGVPQGEDCLVWNAHRIYGKKRLPLLLKGWKVLDVFEQESSVGQEIGVFRGHPLMVLGKA